MVTLNQNLGSFKLLRSAQNATIFSRQSILKIAMEEIVQNAIISALSGFFWESNSSSSRVQTGFFYESNCDSSRVPTGFFWESCIYSSSRVQTGFFWESYIAQAVSRLVFCESYSGSSRVQTRFFQVFNSIFSKRIFDLLTWESPRALSK